MRVEELSQLGHKWLDVDEVGNGLGMDSHTSRALAELIADSGWVTTHEVNGAVKLRLTQAGFDGIAKMKLPAWQRWATHNTSVVIALLALLVAAASFFAKFFGF